MVRAVLPLVILLLLSACGLEEKESTVLEEEIAGLQARVEELENEESNPIDRFYDGLDSGGTTYAMNTAAGLRAGAWEAEARNLAEELKIQLPLQEDKDLVDDYIAAAEEQAGRMDVMAAYPVSDVRVPEPERMKTSGTLRGVLLAEGRAGIWRDTFYQLQMVLPFDFHYTFIFDEDGAREEFPDGTLQSRRNFVNE